MELENFVKKTVKPGEALTAQLWNDNVETLATIVDILKVGPFALRVTVEPSTVDLDTVRVTAVQSFTNLVFEASRPIAPARDFKFTMLKPGSYQVRVEAPGNEPRSGSVTIENKDEDLTLTVTPHPVMPALFGEKLSKALIDLAALVAGIKVSVLDVTGKAEPQDAPSPDAAAAPVLAQIPRAGEPLFPGVTVQLVVAAAPKPLVMVEVPNLLGMTETQARQLLEEKGLQLGTASTKTPSPKTVEVPNLLGMNQDQARQLLEERGLQLGTVSTKTTQQGT